jgi:hypothetical protein
MKRIGMLCLSVVILLAAALLPVIAQDAKVSQEDRPKAQKLMKQGNWKEAYDVFAKLAEDKADDEKDVGQDLHKAVQCLQQLGRVSEFDAFIERVIAAHAGNWRLLQTAAWEYLSVEHYGSIVAGNFERGPHRGGTARLVNSYERDRVRALQLMQQALPLVANEDDKYEAGQFYMDLANQFMGNRGDSLAWRLQYLSDLTTLPDYEDGSYGYTGDWYSERGGNRGAPVDEDGTPVYHKRPRSWEDAKTDGQRWRWALLMAQECDTSRAAEVRWVFAQFLHHQFGVQTMAQYGQLFGRGGDDSDTQKDESGPYALHTLGEDETIARLATGIKRFKLPDEFNYIKIIRELVQTKAYSTEPSTTLAEIFENRRQYPKAADVWRQAIKDYGGGGEKDWNGMRLAQIVGNWGTFEPVMTAPSGKGATVDFRFRNATKVSFEAHEIDVAKLLADVKDYIKTKPKQLDWKQMNIADIGYRLVVENQTKYLKAGEPAKWSMPLKPRPNHFDSRVTVATPLQTAGAYLVTAKVADGNISRIVLWVADTAIVQKQLDKQAWFFVADATTGQPVAKANLEFFGYQQKYIQDDAKRGQGHNETHTRDFAEFTDADGQLILKSNSEAGSGLQPAQPGHKIIANGPPPARISAIDNGFQWLIIATTPAGRLAFMGFNGIWFNNYYDTAYNEAKTYVITDRPVYRPAQKVKFKFWVNRAQYDQEGRSQFAGQSFNVNINNPKGEKVFEKQFKADEFGGFDGQWDLPKEATLGVYSVHLVGGPGGGGTFRVEEYKKPEFEVKIDAPTEPVMLGEKIAATINAKYYFGAPVTNAKVKYKVMRSNHSAQWYPICPWDWYYGPGYWWYAYDYVWYPGWREWGCRRPVPWWWWEQYPQQQPEIVAEAEVAVGPDGTVKVDIDTSVAKALYGNTDHKYEIAAEVTDASRRTIVGTGSVLVARKPFKVYAWVNRGHYRVGDVVGASFKAQTLDNKPVAGKGLARLLKITYKDNKPVETEVQNWPLDSDAQGEATLQIPASQAGQYRLSYKVTDSKKHTIEGAYVFVVRGEGFDGSQFRFNDIELVTDKREYAPGDKVNLMVNTDRSGAAVVLFIRPSNGVYLPPKVLRLTGKSVQEEIEVLKKDMPNFFVEGLTVHGAKVFTDVREVIVPPAKRVLNVEVKPSAGEYKPGAKGKVAVKVTDDTGEPYVGSLVLTMYDKSVEYISGGSNVPDIKEFFWKWRRQHRTSGQDSLSRGGHNILKPNEIGMGFLGVFGQSVADEEGQKLLDDGDLNLGGRGGGGALWAARSMREASFDGAADAIMPAAAMAPGGPPMAKGARMAEGLFAEPGPGGAPDQAPGQPMVEPTVRTQFADTALWVGEITTKVDGLAQFELTMPENLTTWKTRVWALGAGTRVGEGSAEAVTTKNLLIRLQAPRFFVQKDEVVLSANVHNYLKTAKKVRVVLELDGGCLEPILPVARELVAPKTVLKSPEGQVREIPAGGEVRVDWRVKVLQPGQAVVRMKALSDEESDAMEMKFPVFIHGMLKTESFCGVIRPDKDSATVAIRVPAERLPEQSRLELRYSPTLAMAMIDALPYMVDYPYGCTEQTLNRFLPTVITQKILIDMEVNLKDIRDKQTNLNAQEIGDDKERAKQWGGVVKPYKNPVYDEETVRDMVKAGLEKLLSMRCSDGGWGWFSGWGERSYPHTTAVVVHGLQIARANDVAIVPGTIEGGIEWLKKYQAKEVRELKNAAKKIKPWKDHADALDAFVYMVLVDEKSDNKAMREFLYRDRNDLPVYAKAMFGMALHKVGDTEKRDMIIRNIEQFLVQDDENQTAYLKLPENNWWWCWYGSEYEAEGYYLKLLAAVQPKSEKASRLVKYLLNNRKHATYWNSTRDTAVVIEAFADYIKASVEDKPDMTVQILIDGKQAKSVKIDKSNLFTFDNKLALAGDEVTTGEHKIEVRRTGSGPVYFSAYLTNFTLEDPIEAAGLDIKVNRKYYKLEPVDKKVHAEGARGQALLQKVEKYERKELENLAMLKSGDLVEIELEIDSKNDYEYIMFEDMKAAGFEPVEVRSGYNGNDMGAYMELRDERVCFFVRALARGKHSVSYRMRAEIPGKFSALPTKASAMYAPELKANSDEIKLRIED